MTTVIYPARRVMTMNPARTSAPAVAVRDGRVLGVGPVNELAGWGEHVVDDRFSEHVLVPGMVEVHCHAGTGGAWTTPWAIVRCATGTAPSSATTLVRMATVVATARIRCRSSRGFVARKAKPFRRGITMTPTIAQVASSTPTTKY